MEQSELLYFASALILLTNAATLSALATSSALRTTLFLYALGLALSGLAFLLLAFQLRLGEFATLTLSHSLLICGLMTLVAAVFTLFEQPSHWRSLALFCAVAIAVRIWLGDGAERNAERYTLILACLTLSMLSRIYIALRHHRRNERGPALFMIGVLSVNALIATTNLVLTPFDPARADRAVLIGGNALAMTLFSVLALVATMLVVNARTHARLRDLADLDGLTGAYNRRAFFDYANARLRSRDAERPAFVMMLDFDHFKQINDVHGHLAGDHVLAASVRGALALVRPDGLVGRHGGEEFAVLWFGDAAGLDAACERLRRAVGTAASAALGHPVTTSVGATRHRKGETLIDAIGRADVALYRAKAEGRDRSVVV